MLMTLNPKAQDILWWSRAGQSESMGSSSSLEAGGVTDNVDLLGDMLLSPVSSLGPPAGQLDIAG